MTTLEKMARAGYHTGGKFPSWEDAPQAVRDMAILRVRAELEVLKEPSEEAMRAAEQTDSMKFVAMVLLQAQNHGMGELPEGTRIVRDVWQAMRTAILEGRA